MKIMKIKKMRFNEVFLVYFAMIIIISILFIIAIVMGLESIFEEPIQVQVIDVQTSPDTIVVIHKEGAYHHTYEYDATKYFLTLVKTDDSEAQEFQKEIVVNEIDRPWAEQLFVKGNILEYKECDGFNYRYGLKLVD